MAIGSQIRPENSQDVLVCHCYYVTEGDILEKIDAGCEPSVEGVLRSTCAGMGCTACHCRIKRLLRGQTSPQRVSEGRT